LAESKEEDRSWAEGVERFFGEVNKTEAKRSNVRHPGRAPASAKMVEEEKALTLTIDACQPWGVRHSFSLTAAHPLGDD
jgi:hypothetical protein